MEKILFKMLCGALSLLFCFSFFACSTTETAKNENQEKIFFPEPPDTARIQFLTTISTSRDVEGPPSFWSKYISGRSLNKAIIKPNGVASTKNRLYVIDSKISSVDIINLKDKSFSQHNPPGLGNLKFPLSCNADTEGNLFVADQGRKEIVVFDYDMNYKNSFGSNIISKPADVCAYKDRIYVADMDSFRIQVFSNNDYKLLFSFPNVKTEDTAFLHKPIHLTVQNDVIYVTDFGEFQIKKYDLAGKYLGSVGQIGDHPGTFSRPKGLAVDKSDLLYAIDAEFNSIQIFNKLSQLLLFFGGQKSGRGFLDMPIKITIDYDNIDYFKDLVDEKYRLKYLIYVANQFGNDKITVYGFVDLK